MAAPANRPVQSVASSSRSIGALCPKRTRPSSRPAARAPAASARPPSRAATGPRREGCPDHGRRSAGRAPRGSGRRRFPAPHAARARCGAGCPSAARARPALVPSGDRRRRVARISLGDSCVGWPWTPNLQRAASAREHRAPPPCHGPRRPSYGIPPSGAVWDVKETRVMLTSESRVWRRCAARVAVLAVAACGGSQQGLIGPGRAAKLAILVQPSAATAGAQIRPAVQVAIQDAFGNAVATATNHVTAALGNNPGGGTLSGTTTASPINGRATFSDLSVDKAGTGYTLAASATGLTDATSIAFNINPPLIFTTIAAGGSGSGSHTCGVTTAGAIYCWGSNSRGQIGDNSGIDQHAPALVQAPAGVLFQAVSAGGQHTCAVTTTGDAYCWGRNEFGRLGDGTGTDRRTPVLVAAPAGVTFTSVSAGAAHSCGLAAPGGMAYCWGGNSFGQLGDNSGTDQPSPVLVQAPPGVTFTAVTTGFFHSCGLAPSGAVYCWGDNGSGELGDNTSVAKPTPVQANAPAGVTFATLDAGYYHTCAVTPTGAAYCWGANGSGQLGDNTAIGKPVPTAVQGGLQFALVSGGADHTCGVTTTGIGYCWGFNGDGEIGDNTTLNRLTPKAIAGSLSLSIPAAHECEQIGRAHV